MSSNDQRFVEFLKCFKIIFGTSIRDIMADYNAILPMVNISKGKYTGMTNYHGAYDYVWITTTDRVRITNSFRDIFSVGILLNRQK